jgi:hypothetical protein
MLRKIGDIDLRLIKCIQIIRSPSVPLIPGSLAMYSPVKHTARVDVLKLMTGLRGIKTHFSFAIFDGHCGEDFEPDECNGRCVMHRAQARTVEDACWRAARTVGKGISNVDEKVRIVRGKKEDEKHPGFMRLFLELKLARRLESELETEDSRLPQGGGEKSTAEVPLLAGSSRW